MSRTLYRIGRASASRPWWVLGAWLVAAVAVVVSSAAVGNRLRDSVEAPGVDSQRAVDLLDRAGAGDAGITAQVVLTPTDPAVTFDAPAARQAVADVRTRLLALPDVVGASDPLVDGGVSADGRVALVRVQYPVVERLDADDLAALKDALAEARAGSPLRIEAGGDLFFSFEQPRNTLGELLGLLVAVLVLLVAFGSLVAMGLPLALALFGLTVGISALPLLDHLVEIPSFSTVIGSMVGLGVGIDYALFLVTRHREHLAAGHDVVDAAALAVATAGRAVLFAGGTVVVSILGLATAGMPSLTAAGLAISLIVALMVAASITLLPALLRLAGTRIDRFGLPHRHRVVPADRQVWHRWGAHMSRHALPYAAAGTVALLALAAPTLSLRLGFPDDGNLPVERTERRAYDLVAGGFGAGTNGPLVVAVALAGDPSVVDRVQAAVAADPGIASVAPPTVDEAAGVAALVAVSRTAPQDAATVATIERLRADVLPAALAGTGATAHVGGQTATFADLGNRVKDRLPVFVTAVVAVSFLLLTVVFRSLLVPLKAALLNLLSIGASYGVLVMVFQWEWGARLIGVHDAVPIVSFIPLLMFAIVFGLSMDYEVFLLSRIREHYAATGDNEHSVVEGLAGTGRVITSAALIMVSVFAGFVFGDDPSIKMLGLGLATAIAIDATVVRMVLVPATMTLMGKANWWLPSWLDKRLPRVDLEASAA